MTGWMFLFMGIYDKNTFAFLFGIFLVIVNLIFIRTQFMISKSQYIY